MALSSTTAEQQVLRRLGFLLFFAALLSPLSTFGAEPMKASTLPDLSGMGWINGEVLLAVHDAKNPAENDRPRVSRLWLPESLDGILWQPITLDWPPPLGPANDLESAAPIPGTAFILLLESGDDEGVFRRVFLAEYRDQRLRLESVVPWPKPVNNVEGSAVVRVGERFWFVYAERAQGRPSTRIAWAELQLHPLRFGSFREVGFSVPDPTGPKARPVSAIEADADGYLYVASAFDSGDDNGPFRSVVWRIGRLAADAEAGAEVRLFERPQRLATLDGLKVESLAIRPNTDGALQLFAGMDDENYGGTFRLIPAD